MLQVTIFVNAGPKIEIPSICNDHQFDNVNRNLNKWAEGVLLAHFTGYLSG